MTYIVVEGVIGVGKTTLTRLLGEQLGVPILLEEFEENPFLGSFYTDRERYAFQTETFFLLNRYRHQQSVIRPAVKRGSLVADYMFAKTRLFAGLNLRGDEWDLFLQLYGELARRVAQPDLVVYLRASVDTLLSRIYQRDRSYERKMEHAYIEELAAAYEEFFGTYRNAPLVTLDTDELDLVRDGDARTKAVQRVATAARLPG